MANPSKVFSRVRSVDAFGDGVYQVTFDVPTRYTRYLPGQFLHLTLDHFDPTTGYWPESRVFSIASEPKQDHVTIVYSVKGNYTKRMESELKVGRDVWLKLPYGDFVIEEELLEQGPLALVAGGTGVSPYWPFLKRERHRTGVVHLFYGIRQPEHLLFRSGIEELLQASWFRLHLCIEQGGLQGLPQKKGRLSVDDVALQLGDSFLRAHFFLSGPPIMIKTFERELKLMAVDPRRIHIDEWE